MAKVIGPLNSSEARGSVNELTYMTIRGARVVRARYTPVTEYSDKQNAVRAATAAATVLWQSRTPAVRAQWEQYALDHPVPDWTGTPKRLSGYNWFIKCNYWGRFQGYFSVLSPPSQPAPPALQNVSSGSGAGNIPIYWTPLDPPGILLNAVLLYHYGPHLASVTPNFSMASFFDFADDHPGVYWLTDPAAGTHTFWLKRIRYETGLISIMQRTSFVAT